MDERFGKKEVRDKIIRERKKERWSDGRTEGKSVDGWREGEMGKR